MPDWLSRIKNAIFTIKFVRAVAAGYNTTWEDMVTQAADELRQQAIIAAEKAMEAEEKKEAEEKALADEISNARLKHEPEINRAAAALQRANDEQDAAVANLKTLGAPLTSRS